nr:MAG: structural polyprotein [Hangzhou picorna-like virus 1]
MCIIRLNNTLIVIGVAVIANLYHYLLPMIDNTSDESNIVTEMINVDNEFKKISEQDFDINSQNMTTTVASVTTREIQEIDSPFNDLFMKVDIPDAYRVDAKSFIERPFYVDEVTFPDTAARYTLLTSTVKFLPGDIARSNTSVLNMFKMAAYGRPDLVINVSMAGTITHAGCVLVGVLPPFPKYPVLVSSDNKRLINTILSGPHAFLHANEATSVAIPVPWYCNTDLATTDMEQSAGYNTTLDITITNGNYATLVYLVLNPLQPSTGSTKSLKIIVEACFKNFDLAVPTPRFVTWVPQGGKTNVLSLYNPCYEDFDRIAAENGLLEWIHASPHKRKMIMQRVLKYSALLGSAIPIAAVLLRLGFICIAGEDVLPIDHVVKLPEFQPQAGVLSNLAGLATGLLDSAANGLKTVAADAIDSGRSVVRQYTGLHNPNVPHVQERVIVTSTNFVNNTDCPQYFEKLDPFIKFNRIVKEPIFGSDIDEMAVSNIVTKKQLIGSFKVDINDSVGALKWVRPISPFQGGAGPENSGGILCFNNLELLHSMSRGWRGSMKLTIQSVMNNKQQCKLKVIKMYNPSVSALTGYPAYKSIVNAPTHLLEFTQGGQEHEVDLPYLCRNDITPCATNTDTEALFHGLYYIYVAQPLVISDSSPNNVEFNVYLNGEPDLTFYGYTTATTYHSDFNTVSQPVSTAIKDKKGKLVPFRDFTSMTRFEPEYNFYKYANDEDTTFIYWYINDPKGKGLGVDMKTWTKEQKDDFAQYKKQHMEKFIWAHENWRNVRAAFDSDAAMQKAIDTWKYSPNMRCTQVELGSLRTYQILAIKRALGVHERPGFKPQSGSIKVMNEPQHQSHTTRVDEKQQQVDHMSRLMPSLDVRHFFRRMYKSQVYEANAGPTATANTVLKLASFIGESPNLWNYTPIETFSRMYYGKSVGFKFRCLMSLVNHISTDSIPSIDFLNLRVYYVPQNVNALQSSKAIVSAPPNANSFPSPFTPSDGTPLPFQIIGKESTKTHVVYEFTVPDTSFYKFMGGPNKFYNFDSNGNPEEVAQGDFGSILFQITNLSRDKQADYTFEVFVGLTDESRFGYHSIAPPFVVYKTTATYTGNSANSTAPPSNVVNTYLYKGGYL